LTPWEQQSLAPIFGLVSIVPVLVLLVACANAANVLMAHHTARRREFAMRRAIGASRGRLVRQLMAESLVVALLAGLAGFCHFVHPVRSHRPLWRGAFGCLRFART